eukprot:2220114-Rhodomonas_salina.4
MTVRMQHQLNLLWVAVATFLSMVVVVIVSTVLTRDDKFVTVVSRVPASYDDPPYRSLVFFGHAQNVTTYFSMKILQVGNQEEKGGGNNSNIAVYNESWFSGDCGRRSKDTCVVANVVTNHTVHKTVSMGIVEHPGVSTLGYGIPVSIILGSKALLGILWAFDRLVVAALLSYVSFLFVLAHSELRDSTHVVSGFFAFASFLFCHWYVMKRTYAYYPWKVTYKWSIFTVSVMYTVLGFLSLTEWNSGAYVTYELCCIAALLPLQLFPCHIMRLMSPTELSIKMSPLLLGDSDVVGCMSGMSTPRFSVDTVSETAALQSAGGFSGTTRDTNEP